MLKQWHKSVETHEKHRIEVCRRGRRRKLKDNVDSGEKVLSMNTSFPWIKMEIRGFPMDNMSL